MANPPTARTLVNRAKRVQMNYAALDEMRQAVVETDAHGKPTHVEGVDAEAPLVGETLAEGEGIEHAQMGQPKEEWDKHRPHWPADEKKDGEPRP